MIKATASEIPQIKDSAFIGLRGRKEQAVKDCLVISAEKFCQDQEKLPDYALKSLADSLAIIKGADIDDILIKLLRKSSSYYFQVSCHIIKVLATREGEKIEQTIIQWLLSAKEEMKWAKENENDRICGADCKKGLNEYASTLEFLKSKGIYY